MSDPEEGRVEFGGGTGGTTSPPESHSDLFSVFAGREASQPGLQNKEAKSLNPSSPRTEGGKVWISPLPLF